MVNNLSISTIKRLSQAYSKTKGVDIHGLENPMVRHNILHSGVADSYSNRVYQRSNGSVNRDRGVDNNSGNHLQDTKTQKVVVSTPAIDAASVYIKGFMVTPVPQRRAVRIL